MASSIQRRRGTTSDHATFTGAVGEITIDTTKDTVVVHDGAVVGGVPLLREDLGNLPAGAVGDAKLATIATAGKVSNSATTATSALGINTIVARDGSNNFTAGTITAAVTGAASSNVLKAGDTMTGALVVPLASAAAPSLTFTGDLNTGIFSPGADQVAISTNGTGRLFVDASGRIIIGASTAAIGTPLEVVSSSNGLAISVRGRSSDNIGIVNFYPNNSSSEYARIQSNGDSSLSFGTGSSGTERLRITSAGNVGIGTSSPGALLTVGDGNINIRNSVASASNVREIFNIINPQSNVASSGGLSVGYRHNLSFPNRGSSVRFIQTGTSGGQDANSAITFFTYNFGVDNGAERMRIDNAGRVGIGTNAPAEKLTVSTGSDSDAGNISIGLGTVTAGASRRAVITKNTSGPFEVTLEASSGATNVATIFKSSGTNETARIDSSGRLLVGTSSARTNFNNKPDTTALQIEATSFVGASLSLVRNTASAFSGGIIIGKTRGASVGSNTLVANGDSLGIIYWQGADGTNMVPAAMITALVDGTPGVGDMPGRLVFSTTADGAASPTERMRIRATGVVGTQRGLVVGSLAGGINDDALIISGGVIASGAGNFPLKWNSSTGIVTYDTSSRFVKERIVDCPYGIDALKQLQPRKYFRTDDQQEEIGFVADELAQVMPEFVPIGPKLIITRNSADIEGVPLGVNYDKLTAVLTKALQEAIFKIETLEAKVAALESA